MPVIQITLLEGRTTQQKRRIAERITDVVVEEAGAARDGVVITFVDVPFDSYSRGGVLMQDQREQKTIKT
jgi:4-oxalocrotonate tautomerase